MKKYLLGVAAVVMALSLSAFTGESNVEAEAGSINLHWFKAPYGSGDYMTTTTSVAQRLAQINCVEAPSTECERAFTDAQLLSTDPEDGIDPDEVNQQFKTIYRRP